MCLASEYPHCKNIFTPHNQKLDWHEYNNTISLLKLKLFYLKWIYTFYVKPIVLLSFSSSTLFNCSSKFFIHCISTLDLFKNRMIFPQETILSELLNFRLKFVIKLHDRIRNQSYVQRITDFDSYTIICVLFLKTKVSALCSFS